MTEDKARKRAIRARMTKTGERYTAARRHVVEAPLPPRVEDPGMPDASVVKGTGHDWDHWLRELDRWDATERTHTEIARHVGATYDVSGWWAQSITVGYERARGMRAKYQTTHGFSVSASKTLPAPVEELFPLLAEASERRRWVPEGTLRQRTVLPTRVARFDGPEGSRVVMSVDPKGPSKTTVTIGVERLPDAVSVERARAFWKERLAALAEAIG